MARDRQLGPALDPGILLAGTDMTSGADDDFLRIDKWLWAARFFKTRSLAAAAVTGGKVQVDGQRVKPAKSIGPGMRLHIRRGEFEIEVTVRAVSAQRGPAPQAARLYAETEQSMERRAQRARERRERAAARARGAGRPTKRERRQIDRVKGR